MMNDIPFITAAKIREALSIPQAIAVLRQALRARVDQASRCPMRNLIWCDNPRSVFGSMPGYYPHKNLFVNKMASFVAHEIPDQPLVNCLVMTFDTRTGKPLALLDGSELTNLKCAAVTGVITHQCAAAEARILALVGAGTLATQQLLAVLAVRDIAEVRIANRSQQRAARLVDYIKRHFPLLRLVISESAQDAASGADIICTATGSFSPLLNHKNIKETAHLNIMGAHTSSSREVSYPLLEDSFLIVEDRETAIEEAGKVHENAIDIFELLNIEPQVLAASRTLFSSTGHIMMDMIITSEILVQSGLVEF
ncbi:ornithine cyclodeaminase family protein [Klebsiella quasipneumoniae]|uniref:ornithine cyclodeaminase family protein n=1 Tax=Klebsiella quasipneumoniae TaxID=1463165 RepID=UPI0007A047CD|nr:ornithine cyclodeaminase family protein [Klebsiella quasipneumoniae]KYZ74127.1 hypothetical protein A2G95_20090 [Klebsiella quasipneumoniae subsp. similipneumoniae]HBR1563062.1 ornithine cyclodeaminase family protein [Klebsiella quasipneumoniae subsp. similipneumoniae]